MALDHRVRHGRRRLVQGSLALAGLGLLSGCGMMSSQAQPPTNVARLGYLEVSAPPVRLRAALVDGLREHGYVEGQSIVIESRFADGALDRLPDLAAELVRLAVDVIVARGPAVRVARAA